MENYDTMDITIVLWKKLWYDTERYTMEKSMVLWKKLWYYSKLYNLLYFNNSTMEL